MVTNFFTVNLIIRYVIFNKHIMLKVFTLSDYIDTYINGYVIIIKWRMGTIFFRD